LGLADQALDRCLGLAGSPELTSAESASLETRNANSRLQNVSFDGFALDPPDELLQPTAPNASVLMVMIASSAVVGRRMPRTLASATRRWRSTTPRGEQFGIAAAGRDEVVVMPVLDQPAVLQHQDPSARIAVDRRWAIAMVVRPAARRSRARAMRTSVSASTDDVASSRSTTSGVGHRCPQQRHQLAARRRQLRAAFADMVCKPSGSDASQSSRSSAVTARSRSASEVPGSEN